MVRFIRSTCPARPGMINFSQPVFDFVLTANTVE
jgi:hypothetical protein